MTNQEGTPLHLHTLESLVSELLAGRDILVGNTGEKLQLEEDTRKIFQWYAANRQKWPKACMKEDVAALAKTLAGALPPTVAASTPPARIHTRRLHLQRVRAHRFGGLHRFGNNPNDPNPLLDFDLKEPLTLIEGKNGSGKTSLLSAITWCLTGQVFRALGERVHAGNPVYSGLT